MLTLISNDGIIINVGKMLQNKQNKVKCTRVEKYNLTKIYKIIIYKSLGVLGMDKKLKEKVKKATWKMFQIQTLGFIVLISVSLSYYTRKFYQNKSLVFGVEDSKLLLGLVAMFCWVMLFTVYLMIELIKKDKIIINQNEFIKGQNNTIQSLLNQVIQQNNDIEENTKEILDQNDYIVERNEEIHTETIKSNRSLQNLILLEDRSDDIA